MTSSDDGIVPLGLWTHVAVSLKSANLSLYSATNCPVYDDVIVTIYINGQPLNGTSLTRTVVYAPAAAAASTSASLSLGPGLVGTVADVALYNFVLNATQLAARAAAAAVFTPVAPAALPARAAWCDTSLYTTRVLGDAPLLYWRMDESLPSTGLGVHGNCGFDATDGVISPFAPSSGLVGRGVAAPAASFPPAFTGAATMTAAVPSALVWPVASLFKARAEQYATLHASPAVVLEAMVYPSQYSVGASIVSIDIGAPGGKGCGGEGRGGGVLIR